LSVGESEQVHIACKNTSGVSISKGTPVYITGTVGTSFVIEIAAADASNAAKMPAVGLVETDLSINAEGYVIASGVLKNLTTDPLSSGDGTPSSNDTIYVKAGGGLTKTKPTGSGNYIQNVGKVGRVNSSNAGSIAVSTIMRTNDVPNLSTGKVWVGTSTYTSESGIIHLDESNARLGVNNISPTQALDITGNVLSSGSIEGSSIVKTGGTSSQFLKADGSVDSNTYLTSETDPIFTASPANGITNTNITNWNTAYGWGDHSLEGYLTSESDTLSDVTGRGSSTTDSITVGGLHVNSTGAVEMPTGSTLQRPTGVAGMFRFNSDDSQFEGYDGTQWGAIAGSGGGGGGSSTIYRETFSGNGSTTSFTLSTAISDEANTQVYIDGVYQSKLNYSTSGTSLTFTTAPPTGTNNIEVVHIAAVTVSSTSGLIQNSFTGNGSTVDFTLSITPTDENFTFVFIQGVYQDKSTYTVSGNTITFSTAPQNGYSIEVMSIGAVNLQQVSYLEYDNFTGNGSTTNYTLLNGSPSDEKFTMVYIQGVYQEKSTYSLSAGDIIFSTAPQSGYTIEIISVNGGGIQTAQSYTPIGATKVNVEVISTNTTAVGHNYLYVLTASLTLTLPSSPEVGDSIKISNRSGTTTCVLAANGNNIMGSASDLTIDALNAGFELIYSGTSEGWIIIGN
jgi:hypothetical protein